MRFLKKLVNEYPIFKKLSSKHLNLMETSSYSNEFAKNTFIKRADEECMGFPFIIDGALEVVKLSSNGEITFLYTLKEGDLCHHAYQCIINNHTLFLQVRAIKDSTLVFIPLDIFNQYFLNDITFSKYLYKDLFNKFERLVNTQERLIHTSIDERLLTYLRKYKCREIKITHQQLANELGSAREVISRHLKRLENDGILVLKRGSIIIKCDND